MGYQFAHVETYSLHGSTMKQKKGQARSTVGDVIGEAMRDDGHVSHLLKAGYTPAPPTFLHGDEVALRSIPDKIQQHLDAATAGIVVVKVPPAPKAIASISMEPGANAPGIPTPAPVPVWMPSAPPGLG